MEKPEVVRYGDGHYRQTIYGLGPYIADYLEQVLLACIMQGWCPRYEWLFVWWILILMPQVFRCNAHWKDLDHGDAGRRAHRHTEALFEAVGKNSLWDDYGIISDIMVRFFIFPKFGIKIVSTAFYIWISACGYPWTLVARPPSSSYQGHIQRSHCYMGYRVYQSS